MRNETAEAALRLARRGPLIVTGIAGIGKSWLLRRVAALAARKGSAAPFAEVEVLDGARGASAAAIAERLAQPDPRRLLVLDGLEQWIAPSSPLLDALACSRGPIVLSAPPLIWEICAGMRGVSAFLAERCRSLVIGPLAPLDRRALLGVEGDADAVSPGIRARFAARALDPMWGGHPRVLEQVRAILCDPTEAALGDLVAAVSARLPHHASSILGSLTSLERRAIFAVVRGTPIGEPLRGAALSLVLHGALVRRSDGWEVADPVLALQLKALA